ncbi:hypothetical protein [Streptomyces sp. Inha503]|uniref:hypothetical protein n=1 Tax=Streptomyces sp. Inha503 TaxID=3383314 RepID=UPI0039A04E72
MRIHLETVVKYKNEHQNELIARNIEDAMQEASSCIHEATIALKASHTCAAKIMVLGPQALNGVTADVVGSIGVRLGSLRAGLEAIRREERPDQWLRQEAEHNNRFATAFSGFTARAAFITEGHELPSGRR